MIDEREGRTAAYVGLLEEGTEAKDEGEELGQLFRRHFGLAQDRAQRARCQLAVSGYHRGQRAGDIALLEDDVTAALSNDVEPRFLEGSDQVLPREDRQLAHYVATSRVVRNGGEVGRCSSPGSAVSR